jgi:BlaI family penicillinase repressor
MKPSIHITEAEWEVMVVVWEEAPVAARRIMEALSDKKRWTLTTVRTLLRRLVNKGALSQKPAGKRYLYTPRITMIECVQRECEVFLDRTRGRIPAKTILEWIKKADLSKQDIYELRRMIREKELLTFSIADLKAENGKQKTEN